MPKKRKPQKKPQQKNYSTITQHKLQGKKLIPPIYQIGDQKNASWRDDRLPEMLWATLLVTHLPRENALNVFRQVAKYVEELPEEDKFYDVTHTGLSKLPPEHQDAVLSIIVAQQEQQEVLTSLLLLDELPGREAWAKVLNIDRVSDNWIPLMISVSDTLWHQTQESTDCRWLKVLCRMVAGKIKIAFEKLLLKNLKKAKNGLKKSYIIPIMAIQVKWVLQFEQLKLGEVAFRQVSLNGQQNFGASV